MLEKLVVLKLNGGLGTSMGCVGPKSKIEVRDEHTFLDLTVQQVVDLCDRTGADVPLVLMSSFNTHKDTKRIVRKYQRPKIDLFNQSQYPRLLKETLMPVDGRGEELSAWYPPGHGDVYRSLAQSGLLDKYLSQGREWAFVSNVDNLGANVDVRILKYLCEQGEDGAEFLAEVTAREPQDVKGGTLVTDDDGSVRLLEIAQVPKAHRKEFQSVRTFPIFNTNNLWVNLKALKKRLDSLELEIIVNNKTLADGTAVIQLETACGAAIRHFKNAVGLKVPRSRFLPVKSTSDLFIVQSNLYALQEGHLALSKHRDLPGLPLVKLGASFRIVAEYLERLGPQQHNILELTHLTISGSVRFLGACTFIGTVILVAENGGHIDVPAGSVLENCVVTGGLKVTPH